MKVIKAFTIQQAYKKLIKTLKRQPAIGSTKELTNCCLVVSNPSIKDFYLPYRHVSEKYANAELEWYWSADNRCHSIGKYAKMWLELSDDGNTNNSAYGYILFKKYGFNQLEQIIKLLKKDKTTRRAVLNISDPTIDRIHTKDMQCTIAIQFLIRDNKLQETVYMRSNDVYFGLPYDYLFFMSIGNYICKRLHIKMGTYTHNATSMHMYLANEESFKKQIIKQKLNININNIIRSNYEK